MSMFDDFRGSLETATAKRRLAYYNGLLQTLGAQRILEDALSPRLTDETAWLADNYSSPCRTLERLLTAHVDFAKAQLGTLAKDGTKPNATPATAGESNA